MAPRSSRKKKDEQTTSAILQYIDNLEAERSRRANELEKSLEKALIVYRKSFNYNIPEDLLDVTLKEISNMNLDTYFNAENKENTTSKVESKKSIKKEVPVANEDPPAPILETVMRPAQKERVRHLCMTTPAGQQVRVPTNLALKVGCIENTVMRRARPDEVGFSVNGSPIIHDTEAGFAGGATPTNIITEILTTDENDLTPTSRALAANIKQLMRKKAIRESGV